MTLDGVPNGNCVDCGVKTYLFCQEVDDWHCTTCDDNCP